MRPAKHLVRLKKATTTKLNRLKKTLVTVATTPDAQERDRVTAFVTIELLNCWNSFCRSFFLSNIAKTRSTTGTILSVGSPLSFNNALETAIRLVRHNPSPNRSGMWARRDEPAWHDYSTFLRACQAVSCSHYTDISNAFTLGATVFGPLTKFRNFFAHRNEETQRVAMSIARGYGISANLRPSSILWQRAIARPQPLIYDYIDELSTTVEVLCEI